MKAALLVSDEGGVVKGRGRPQQREHDCTTRDQRAEQQPDPDAAALGPQRVVGHARVADDQRELQPSEQKTVARYLQTCGAHDVPLNSVHCPWCAVLNARSPQSCRRSYTAALPRGRFLQSIPRAYPRGRNPGESKGEVGHPGGYAGGISVLVVQVCLSGVAASVAAAGAWWRGRVRAVRQDQA